MKQTVIILLMFFVSTMGHAEEVYAPSSGVTEKKNSKNEIFLDIGGGFAGISYHGQNGLDGLFTDEYSYDADGAGWTFNLKMGKIWNDAFALFGDVSYAKAIGSFHGTEGCLFCKTEEMDENVDIGRLSVGLGVRGYIRNSLSVMNNVYLGGSLLLVKYDLDVHNKKNIDETVINLGLEIGKQWSLGEHWLIGPEFVAMAGLDDFTFNALLTVSRK